MKNSNNNQKYIAKAAYFIPYALSEDMNHEDIMDLLFETGDYMANFPEINMLTKCAYVETKTGSIAQLTEHVDYLDRWQFEEELKQKNVQFLVIPEGSENNVLMNHLKEIIGNVFEAGIGIFDAEAHEYVNPSRNTHKTIDDYFADHIDDYFKRVTKIVEITDDDFNNLTLDFPYLMCMYIPYDLLKFNARDTIRRYDEAAALFGIEHPIITYESLMCENSLRWVVCVDPLTLKTIPSEDSFPDREFEVTDGQYKIILLPSLNVLDTDPLFSSRKHVLIGSDIIFFGLAEMKGLCSEHDYETRFNKA